MSVSKRLGAAAVAMLAASPAMAGDWDEAPLRGGYVHLGLSGIKQADEGNLWLGGMPISGADYATQFKTEVSIEAGYFFNDVFAVSAFGTAPMTSSNMGTGSIAMLGNLGDETAGFYSVTAHAHLTVEESFRPYVGAGVGYMHVFDVVDGSITDLDIESAFGGVLQAGVDFGISDTVGVFVDVKKFILGTRATGTLGGVPVVAETRVDPLIITTGVGFSF